MANKAYWNMLDDILETTSMNNKIPKSSTFRGLSGCINPKAIMSPIELLLDCLEKQSRKKENKPTDFKDKVIY